MSEPVIASLTALIAHSRNRSGVTAVSTPERGYGFHELFGLVAGAVHDLRGFPRTVAIAGPNTLAWLVADLALSWTGRRLVPVPPFFSPGQTEHLIRDARIERIVWSGEPAEAPVFAGVPSTCLSREPAGHLLDPAPGAERVVYTSGTTGTPKGVVHGARQINAVLAALAKAVNANDRDIHLSCLPFALLLEQISAIHLPILVGGRTHVSPAVSSAANIGDLVPLAGAISDVEPTTMVLVPQLLAGLVNMFEDREITAPAALRLIAVGGAPVATDLICRAGALRLPVHEGYGLSECCSVVALNRAGENAPGTVGRPLDGVEVSIEDGEIVVHGPSVMAGYLNHPGTLPGARPAGSWHTGDLGTFDADGRLIVHGRKDSVIVTANGRNISPEWIEAMLDADPRIARALLIGHGAPYPTAILWLTAEGQLWHAEAGDAALTKAVARLVADAPVYARPGAVRRARPEDNPALLFTPSGRPRRAVISGHFAARDRALAPDTTFTGTHTMTFYDRLLDATSAERSAFRKTPIIRAAIEQGVPTDLYLAYLTQAYQHVSHTCPLLALAAAHTEIDDTVYRDALFEYIDEEKGHELWILDDIEAMGGDREAARRAPMNSACRVMIGYVHYAIEHVSPYAMLGMGHVLEGMSVELADAAAKGIRDASGASGEAGFSYLTSHGAIDQKHVAFFRDLVNQIDDPEAQAAIIDTARVVYKLFGEMFTELGAQFEAQRDAA